MLLDDVHKCARLTFNRTVRLTVLSRFDGTRKKVTMTGHKQANNGASSIVAIRRRKNPDYLILFLFTY